MSALMSSAHIAMQSALDETLTYLRSSEALDAIRADPYWPKWDSPWWRVTLLWELGQAALVPASVTEALVDSLNRHYLREFPQPNELPPGADPYRHVICHCALGTIWQVLHACSVDVDGEVPWMRRWVYRYQLRDGGLNCDESAYSKPFGKSSIVSTLPPLEAVLRCTQQPVPDDAARFLEDGARYLLKHRLIRRASADGDVIDPAWLQPTFPRFYHYDILRALSFVTEWAEATGTHLSAAALGEARTLLEHESVYGGIRIERRAATQQSPTLEHHDGMWKFADTSRSFALLDQVSQVGRRSPELTLQAEQTRARLDRLAQHGLLDG